MKKIMFNDRYGLTQAVLEGRMMQTRRIITTNLYNSVDWKAYEEGNYDCIITDDAFTVTDIRDYAAYRVGEEVAVAQNYNSIMRYYHSLGNFSERKIAEHEQLFWNAMREIESTGNDSAMRGDSNKIFVRADLMPHRIRITNVRVEQLQDISEEDCLKEGIDEDKRYSFGNPNDHYYFDTSREAFASLIDKTCGRGTWQSNPYVFVYDFELVKK